MGATEARAPKHAEARLGLLVDARAELVGLLRAEAVSADAERASALTQLATNIDALPKNHPTARVLRSLRPFEREEFPNGAVRSLISSYGLADERDEAA